MMAAPFGFLIAQLFRWFPHATGPGLYKVGSPDENSPVVVTANFSLTVDRVRRALSGEDLWLLVANSDGVNVWCAAAGGGFNHNRVIDAVKVSGLADKVKHRELILPALSAMGMDRKAIKEDTGFASRFGPVLAADIPAFLAAGKKKTEDMRRFRFDIKHRADMFLSMNFPIYLVMAMVLAIFWREYLLGATALFWSAVAILYLLVHKIPGKTGWGQAIIAATVFVAAWAGIDWIRLGLPLAHWGWFIAAYFVFVSVGFDLAGIATGRKSDPEQLLLKLGIKSLGDLMKEKDVGDIHLDPDKCKRCRSCFEICPNAVFAEPGEKTKAVIDKTDACFSCGACVAQCPAGALSLLA